MERRFTRIYLTPAGAAQEPHAAEPQKTDDWFLGRAMRYLGVPAAALLTVKEGFEYVSSGLEKNQLDDVGTPFAAALTAYLFGGAARNETCEACYHMTRRGVQEECGTHDYPFLIRITGNITGSAAVAYQAWQTWNIAIDLNEIAANFSIERVDDALYVPAAVVLTKLMRRMLGASGHGNHEAMGRKVEPATRIYHADMGEDAEAPVGVDISELQPRSRRKDMPREYVIEGENNNIQAVTTLLWRNGESRGVGEDLARYAFPARTEAAGHPYVLHYIIHDQERVPRGSMPLTRLWSRLRGRHAEAIVSEAYIEIEEEQHERE